MSRREQQQQQQQHQRASGSGSSASAIAATAAAIDLRSQIIAAKLQRLQKEFVAKNQTLPSSQSTTKHPPRTKTSSSMRFSTPASARSVSNATTTKETTLDHLDTLDVDEACKRLQQHMNRVPELAATCTQLRQRYGQRRTVLRQQQQQHKALPNMRLQEEFRQFRLKNTRRNHNGSHRPLENKSSSSSAEDEEGDVNAEATAAPASAIPTRGIDSHPSFFNSPQYQRKHHGSRFVTDVFDRIAIVGNPSFTALKLQQLGMDDGLLDGRFSFGSPAVMSTISLPRKSKFGGTVDSHNRNIGLEPVDHRFLERIQNKKWAQVQVERGVEYNDHNMFEAAIRKYNAALQLDKHCVDAYVSRGAAYANQRQFGRALQDFQQALRLHPDHANAKKYLKVAKKELGLLPAAGAAAEKKTTVPSTSSSSSSSSAAGRKQRHDAEIVDLNKPVPVSQDTMAGSKPNQHRKTKRRKKRKAQSEVRASDASDDGTSSDSGTDSSDGKGKGKGKDNSTVSKIMRLLMQQRSASASLLGSRSAMLNARAMKEQLKMLGQRDKKSHKKKSRKKDKRSKSKKDKKKSDKKRKRSRRQRSASSTES